MNRSASRARMLEPSFGAEQVASTIAIVVPKWHRPRAPRVWPSYIDPPERPGIQSRDGSQGGGDTTNETATSAPEASPAAEGSERGSKQTPTQSSETAPSRPEPQGAPFGAEPPAETTRSPEPEPRPRAIESDSERGEPSRVGVSTDADDVEREARAPGETERVEPSGQEREKRRPRAFDARLLESVRSRKGSSSPEPSEARSSQQARPEHPTSTSSPASADANETPTEPHDAPRPNDPKPAPQEPVKPVPVDAPEAADSPTERRPLRPNPRPDAPPDSPFDGAPRSTTPDVRVSIARLVVDVASRDESSGASDSQKNPSRVTPRSLGDHG